MKKMFVLAKNGTQAKLVISVLKKTQKDIYLMYVSRDSYRGFSNAEILVLPESIDNKIYNKEFFDNFVLCLNSTNRKLLSIYRKYFFKK